MGVPARVLLYRRRGPAVRIALTKDRVHRASFDSVIPSPGVRLGLVRRTVRVVRNLKTLLLKLGHGSLELGNGGADVRKLDDVRLRGPDQIAQLRQGIGDTLLGTQAVRELAQDPTGQRYVADINRHAGDSGKG